MFNMSAPSLADIAAVTRNNDGNDGWGGNNGWWILIILFALFGWGRGGYGYGGNDGGCGCATAGDIQRGFDTSAIVGKLDCLAMYCPSLLWYARSPRRMPLTVSLFRISSL